jgi:hypothetical protein
MARKLEKFSRARRAEGAAERVTAIHPDVEAVRWRTIRGDVIAIGPGGEVSL